MNTMTSQLPQTTTAIGHTENLPVSTPASFTERVVPIPALGPHDLLVEVEAISVNPVDAKLRAGAPVDPAEGFHIPGFDAAGTVVAIGSGVTLFTAGDAVFYAGQIDRPGSNQRLHIVDERITGHRPPSLIPADAASLPLTAITAWECLFDQLKLTKDSTGTLLIIGATGGVGSVMLQLAEALLPLHPQVSTESSLTIPKGQIPLYARIVRPFGEIVAIDDGPRDVEPLKSRCISWHWELMFTRSLEQTPDLVYQHELLNKVSELVDAGTLQPTTTTLLSPISTATLSEAHHLIESGHTLGKVVLSGWE